MKYLYFLKYNNYANRTVKFEASVSDYLGTENENLIVSIQDVKLWNPNDGITTTMVTPNNTDFSTEPDYFITSDNGVDVESRWFIIENVRLQRGQYRCTLKRDVFAEAWDDLMQATCNIDRAILNKYSPLIYNPEPISVNQIITDELEIKDKTGCPWIVFYGTEKPSHIQKSLNYYASETINDIGDYVAENSYNYLPSMNDIQANLLYLDNYDSVRKTVKLCPYGLDWSPSANTGFFDGTFGTVSVYGDVPDISGGFMSVYSLKTSQDAQSTLAMNNKIVFDGTNYYRVFVTESPIRENDTRLASTNELFNACRSIIANNSNIVYYGSTSIDSIVPNNIWVKYKYRTLTMSYIQVTDVDTLRAEVPAASQLPSDSPYYIWAMPYGNIQETIGGNTITTDKDINLAVAMEFSAKNTSNKLYDFQILSYNPLPDEFILPDGSINIPSTYTQITEDGTITKTVDGVTYQVGHIYSIPYASFTRQILLDEPITVDDPKLRNITDMWRLSSPNYASSFEFSVAKNGGLRGFNVRCTYMPINPYIRVAPIFGGIYGSYFEENVRGLICGGDYSMARIADAWVNYQEQAKNFEASFSRDISHLDVMRKYERVEQISGTALGALEGGVIGGKVFGPVGATVGAIGAIGTGIADIAMSEGKYRENKSYATDMHEMQLGNIQAMPRTLARTTAFNVDNRYFPILTLYRCTSDEFVAVTNFIKNRSMSVGIIDKPINYINNTWSFASVEARGFIQGSIININTKFDVHFVDELNDEFQKGAYLR